MLFFFLIFYSHQLFITIEADIAIHWIKPMFGMAIFHTGVMVEVSVTLLQIPVMDLGKAADNALGT